MAAFGVKRMEMQRGLVIGGSVVLLISIAFIVAGWYVFVYPFNKQRDFLLHRVDHRSVAVACLDMMTKAEYKPLIDHYSSGGDPRLPSAVRAIKPFWVAVSSNEIVLMKTGGFYHMGLVFHRSVVKSNSFELVFREERDLNHDIFLYALPAGK